MNISISGVAGMKDAVIASGIKTFIENLGFGIAIEVGMGELPATTPAAPIAAPTAEPEPAAATPKKRKYALRKTVAKPVKAAQKRTPVASAPSGGADPRGTRRDAVRGALSATTGKNYYQLETELKATWPELDRSMISTIVCQLAKGGECEQVEGKWRLCK